MEPGQLAAAAAARAVTRVIDACDQVKAKVAMAAWAREHERRCSSLSARPAASGWRTRWTSTTWRDTTHDPLLAQLRYRLRKHHGAPREGKKIGVACVFSREAVAPPDASCADREGDGSLNCHGYGSVVSVTATFGQCAAGWVLDRIASASPASRVESL